MPIIQMTLVEGRDDATVSHCIKEVARTVHRTLGAPLSAIRVFVNQVPPPLFAVGDRTREEIDAEEPNPRTPDEQDT
jgi:4-oxalocrotonate tautomerase